MEQEKTAEKSENHSSNLLIDSIKIDETIPNFSAFEDVEGIHTNPLGTNEPQKKRGRPKGSTNKTKQAAEKSEPVFTVEYAGLLNKYAISIVGVVSKKDIVPTPEENAVLDKSLCDILNKYDWILSKYGIEAIYLVTMIGLIVRSPAKVIEIKK